MLLQYISIQALNNFMVCFTKTVNLKDAIIFAA
jgi:hypothetical protein